MADIAAARAIVAGVPHRHVPDRGSADRGSADRSLSDRSRPDRNSAARGGLARGGPPRGGPARVLVLVSGAGSNLQALLDASADPAYGANVVAVGSDRKGIAALERAERAGLPTFVVAVDDFAERSEWDAALTDAVAAYDPDLVVLAGFLKLTGAAFLGRFGGRTINTHPALSPAFPGLHAPRQAIAYGVRVTGATIFLLDAGVDTGPIVAQAVVEVRADDDEATLHERIKIVERAMLVDVVGRMSRSGWTLDGRSVTIP